VTRGISSAHVTHLEGSTIRPVVFCKIALDSGDLLIHSGGRSSYSVGGDTYQNVSDYGKVSVVREAAALVPVEIVLQLSGVDTSLVSDAMTERFQGRGVTISIGFVDDDYDLIDTPFAFWRGEADNALYDEDDGAATIYVHCVAVFESFDRPRIERYTSEDLREDYPGDDLFDFLESAVLNTLNWGPFTLSGRVGGNPYAGRESADQFNRFGRPEG